GSTLKERLIPDASTPSHDCAPCVIETSFNDADKQPTPPAATDVSRVRAVACAFVNAGVAAASVTWPRSSEPVPVAVKTPASATVALPATCKSVAAPTVRRGSCND